MHSTDGEDEGPVTDGEEPSSVNIYVRYDSPVDSPRVSDFRIDYHLEMVRAASSNGEGSDIVDDFYRTYSGDTDDGVITFGPERITNLRADRWLIRAASERWTGGWVGECQQDLTAGGSLTVRFTVGKADCGTTSFP